MLSHGIPFYTTFYVENKRTEGPRGVCDNKLHARTRQDAPFSCRPSFFVTTTIITMWLVTLLGCAACFLAEGGFSVVIDPKYYLDPYRVRAELKVIEHEQNKAGVARPDSADAEPPLLQLMHRKQTEEKNAETTPAKQTGPLLLDTATCAKFATEINALQCSLATQVTGYAEGCECQMGSEDDCPGFKDTKEPFKEFFTAQTADVPLQGVRLCMYWKPTPPQDPSPEVAVTKAVTLRNAQHLLDTAGIYARDDANAVHSGWLVR
ncbi:unnamed protein product [Amoebophrya sp. A120]|nr:unnamed protein product [Amoebophrya sp. A120]|eukprot:GSA120T00010983001.1